MFNKGEVKAKKVHRRYFIECNLVMKLTTLAATGAHHAVHVLSYCKKDSSFHKGTEEIISCPSYRLLTKIINRQQKQTNQSQ